ncbi:MAG TPA: polysaccharide biosynthesis C-terminal domain-containing protein [Chitinophagales bacterium]|nr:polysaccharide biosynthesis C-terminal domain-containing protein [Chitinophagales bacterium]
MKKSFYVNLAFLLVVNLLVKPFWIFGIDVAVQNAVQAESYGSYFSLLKISLLFQALLDFGIGNFNNRSVAQDAYFMRRHLSDIFFLKLLLSLVYIGITLFCAVFLQAGNYPLLAMLAGNQILLSFLLYLRTNISGMQFFKTDSLLSVTDKLLMILICGWLLLTMRDTFRIEWFIYAQSASLLFTIIMALIIVGKIHVLPPLRWSTSGMMEIGRKTFPYAMLGLMMSIYFHVDGVMLKSLLPDGNQQAGIYAASWRLLDAANNMTGFLFATLLLPLFARIISEGKNVHELASSSFKGIMLIAVFASITCFFYRNEIIHLLYHHQDARWADILGILMPSFIGFSTVYIYGTLLTANGSMKALNIIALGGMGLNIALNFIFIPRYEAMGAAMATLITQSFVALAHIYATMRIIPFEVNVKQALWFLFFCAGIFLIFLGTKQISESWILNLIVGSLLSAVCALLMKIVDVSKVRNLLQVREELAASSRPPV